MNGDFCHNLQKKCVGGLMDLPPTFHELSIYR